jgi:multidrug efflux system membrane fusion protein
VRQYEGAIKADQGQIDNAKLQLVYTRVTAPAGGRLGLRQVDPGNIVRASDSNGLVVITQLQPISVRFTIPEDNVPSIMKKLQAGEKLPVDTYDRSGKVKLATGALVTVDNQIDQSTGTVKLKAQFANDDYGLFPNQFVNARMLVDVRHDAVVIPTAGVQRGTQGTFAYVVKPDNTVTVRPIKLGPVEGDNAAVESGLAAGEIVVVDGADKLREGAQVEAVSRQAAAVTPGAAAKQGAEKKDGRHRRSDGTAPAKSQ